MGSCCTLFSLSEVGDVRSASVGFRVTRSFGTRSCFGRCCKILVNSNAAIRQVEFETCSCRRCQMGSLPLRTARGTVTGNSGCASFRVAVHPAMSFFKCLVDQKDRLEVLSPR